jgi:hypothetical protein
MRRLRMSIPAPLTKPVPRSKRLLSSGVTAAGDASNAKVVLPFEFVEIVKVPSVGVKSVGCVKDGISQDASTRHRLIRKTQRAVRSAGGDVGDVKGERLIPIHDREQRLTVGAAVEREAVERDRLKGQARQASRSADDNAGRSEVNAGGRERITPCNAEGTGDGAGQSKRRGCAEDGTNNQKMHQFLHETP